MLSITALSPFELVHSDMVEINALLKEFSPNAEKLSFNNIREIAKDDFLFVARDGKKIVGMTTLIIYRKPTGLVGRVEDVMVTEKMRGKGIGRKLMNSLMDTARQRYLKHLELTSNPRRVEARALYESLGFRERNTGVYQYEFTIGNELERSPIVAPRIHRTGRGGGGIIS